MPFLKKPYNLPYLSLIFITVNYELGFKFITPSPPPPLLRHVQVFISVLFFLSLSLLSQLYEDHFSRHLFTLFSDS